MVQDSIIHIIEVKHSCSCSCDSIQKAIHNLPQSSIGTGTNCCDVWITGLICLTLIIIVGAVLGVIVYSSIHQSDKK